MPLWGFVKVDAPLGITLQQERPSPDYIPLLGVIQPVAVVNPVVAVETPYDGVIHTVELTVAVTATGWKVLGTVPVGKNWFVIAINGRCSTGTFTIDAVGYDVVGTFMDTPQFWYLYSSVSRFAQVLEQLIPLPPAANIGVFVDTKAVNGNLICHLLYIEKDA